MFYNPFMRNKKRKTIAVAESCTGGLLGHRITETPGASKYFLGGVIAYSDRIKESMLRVPRGLLRKHGAVSAPAAKRMAEGVRKRFGAELGLGITGIAGPGGGSRTKPVGLVYIALARRGRTSCRKLLLSGKRSQIKRRAAKRALDWLRRAST